MENRRLAPFSLLAAFATDPFSGNPAAVIFHDPSLPLKDLGNIARNLNQPMLAVVSSKSLPSEDPEVEVRSIRFIVPKGQSEIGVCGHATLAAARVLFDLPESVASGKKTIVFKNPFGDGTFKAINLGDGWIEISLPSTVPGTVDEEEKKRLKAHIDKAFGRDVKIKDIKTGGDVYKIYVMTEIDESEDLAGSVVDTNALLGNGYIVNVFTSSSPDPEYAFLSRMFAPKELTGDGEDHVCGSAHGTLAPYWYGKLGIAPGQEVKAHQVSPRGGVLRVVWEQSEGIIKLRGQCAHIAEGQILV